MVDMQEIIDKGLTTSREDKKYSRERNIPVEEWDIKRLVLDLFLHVDIHILYKYANKSLLIEALWEGVEGDELSEQKQEEIKQFYCDMYFLRGYRLCQVCNRVLPFNRFVKDKRYSRGIKHECKDCRNQRERENRQRKKQGDKAND